MTNLEITLTAILWAILAALNWVKCQKAFFTRKRTVDEINTFNGVIFLSCFIAPLFFIGAVIRQVIVEDWK